MEREAILQNTAVSCWKPCSSSGTTCASPWPPPSTRRRCRQSHWACESGQKHSRRCWLPGLSSRPSGLSNTPVWEGFRSLVYKRLSAAHNVPVQCWSFAFTFWDVNYARRSFLCPFYSSVINFRWQNVLLSIFFSGMNRCKSVFNSLIKVTLGQIWYYTKSHITFKNEFFQP